MKKFLLFLCFSLFSVVDYSQTFMNVIGQSNLNEGGQSVVQSPDGNLFIGGYRSDSAVIIKINPLGTILWARTFKPVLTAGYLDNIWQLTITPDSYVIGAGSAVDPVSGNMTGFYFKFDLAGNMLWCKEVNDPRSIYCRRIMPVSSTQYILFADLYDANSATFPDVVTARVDAANGNITWMSARQNYMSVNAYIDDVMSATLGRNSCLYSTGRIYVNGAVTDGMRPYLSKYDSDGNILWSKYLLFNSSQSARVYGGDILYDNDSIVIADFGDKFGGSTVFTAGLIKTDTLGNVIWAQDFDIPLSSSESVNTVIRLPNGYALLGGTNFNGSPTSGDQFIIMTDLNGNLQWCKTFGTAANGEYVGMIASPAMTYCYNRLYFTGLRNNGTQTDILLYGSDLNGNMSCQPPGNITPAVHADPLNSTLCNMTFPADAFSFSSTTQTSAITFTNNCSGYQLNLGNDTTVCGNILLDATMPGASYLWQNGSTSPTFNVTTGGTYWVNVSVNCCEISDTILISSGTFNAQSSSTNSDCDIDNGTATVTPSGGTAPFTFSWSPVGGNNASASGLAPGSYTCTISDSTGCSSIVTVIVGSNGYASANAGNDVVITAGQTVILNGTGSGNSYSWSPSTGLSCTNCQSTNASPLVTTTYYLTVTDSLGCTDIDTVTVFVDISCGTIWVPNAFSPNGDNENDILYVRGDCIEYMDFEVFDRWGTKVFQSSDPSYGWNGTFRGIPCEDAVFMYLLKAGLNNGSTVDLKGNVSLIK